jgi:biopolymer transport protein ExbD
VQFTTHKRRQPPPIIIISLVDILVVLLIFLIVTTTFRQHPALKLVLPDSRQTAQTQAIEDILVVTIARKGPDQPYLPYLGNDQVPVTLAKLESRLKAAAVKNPRVALSIRSDTEAPFGLVVKVMDAAKSARVKSVNAFTKQAVRP